MPSFKNVLCWTVGFSAVQSVHSFLDTKSNSNLAVYWGQNSGNTGQKPLSYYCNNAHIDVFQLAFMTRMNGVGGVPEIDFANQGDSCDVFPNTNLLHCPQIGKDIKGCQAKGKTILLSIGGATYTEGGFPSADAAVAAAQKVWDVFGPVNPASKVPRPFEDAAIDGFDFDFESKVTNMVPFANKLRELMDSAGPSKTNPSSAPSSPASSSWPGAPSQSLSSSSAPSAPTSITPSWYGPAPTPSSVQFPTQPPTYTPSQPSPWWSAPGPVNGLVPRDSPRKFYLTAAPQCVFPDAAGDEMLDGAVSFDAIFVQFYNNFCGLNSFIPGSGAQRAFNLDLWDAWAKSASKNKDVKVFIGMPGSPSAAGSGFVAGHIMQEILGWSKAFSSFGGLMVWDASQAYESGGLLGGLKTTLLQ